MSSAEAAGGGVGEGAFDGAFGGPRVGVDLADAGDAGVGGDADDEGVLPGVAELADRAHAEIDGFDLGDLHGWARTSVGE